MSDKRISQLVERVTIANNDVLPIVALNAATTNKVTISTIQDWMQTNLNMGVTSVAITLPTGLSVTGSPITSTGTFAISFTAGYSIPTNAKQTEWDTAYTNRITSATAPLGIASNVISITQSGTASNGYLSSTDWNTFNNKQSTITTGNLTEATSSVLTITGGTGAVLGSGTSIQVKQASGSQDGFLDSADWTTFNDKQNALSGTGIVKSTGGTISYLTDNTSNWDSAYNDKINSAAVTGTTTKTLTLTQQDGGTITTTWTDLDTGTVTSVGVSMPSAFSVANSPITSSGTIAITGAGTISQYIDGTGALRTFPTIIAETTRLVREVYNNSGTTMTKGTVVYINGGQGNLPTIARALATGDATSAQTYGVVQTSIGNMSNGYIVVVGDLIDMDTQAFIEGTQLYLSPTTAGEYTSTKPYAPQHLVYVGIVTRSHPTQGIIAIKIQNGFEMDELHNVSAQNPNNNDILQYKTATNLWTKVAGSTTNIEEGTRLYYTDARARAAFSESVTGLDYNSTTGVLSTTTGYAIPTAASQTNWDAAYNDKINSAAVTGTTTKTLTLNQQDGGTITASWTDINTDAVSSVFGRTGAVVATNGDYNTDQVTEGTSSLYFTNARSRSSITLTTTGTSGAATYNSTTGVLNIPSYIGGVTSVNTLTGAVTLTTSNIAEGTNLYYTDTRARAAISLTTTGTSGAATYSGGVLNIPNYGSALSGYVPYTGATTNVALGSNTLQVNEKIGTADNKGIYLRGISDSTHKIYYNSTSNNNIWEYNNAILFQYYNAASPVTRFTFATNGDFTAVGNILGANLSGTNTGDQTLAGLGGVPTSRTLTINGTAYDLTADRSWTVSGSQWVTNGTAIYYNVGRVAIGKTTSNAQLEVYAGTKGQIRANGGPSIGAGVDFYTELAGADRRNWGLHTESTNAGDFELLRSASAGADPTIRTMSFNKTGELSIFNFFNVINAITPAIYLDNTGRAGGGGRNYSILSGNTGAGEFSIKDETSALSRFKIGGDGVITTYVSALIGISTDAAAYMRISENQIWRTGGGALYINNSGAGDVIVAGGGGQLLLGTATQGGGAFVTTKDRGITGSNTYFGTGQVRIGGGSDHTTNTVLSVAPGVVQFDRPGVAGGALQINSDGSSTFGSMINLSNDKGIFIKRADGTLGQAFFLGSGNELNIGFGVADTIRFATYLNTPRLTIANNGVIGIGVTPSGTWTTRAAIQLGAYGTSLSAYQGGGGATELGHNIVVTNAFNYNYSITAGATKQYMDGANVIWYRAPIGTAGTAITFNQLANLNDTGLAIGGSSTANMRLSAYTNGSTISSGTVTFATQAKGIEIYNDTGSGTTDSLVGCWFSTGPHKAGIASGRTNAAVNWAVDLRFFVHGPEIAQLDQTYEKMRLSSEGTLTCTGDVVAYGSPSDLRLKIIKEKVPNALESVLKLNGYRFDWKETNHLKNYKEDIGVIAQEVEALFPELARTNDDGYMSVRYQGLTAVLIEAIKEQQKQIDKLKKQVA